MPSYQSFFDISYDLFSILDAKGNYKEVNSAFTNLLMYPESEMRDRPFTFFLHPDDITITQEQYQKAVLGFRNDVIENRFRSSDGNYHWVRWSTIVQDKKGYFYSSGQNISEEKRLKIALKKEQEESKRKVTKAIIQTQETERSKISQELHDNVNQVLTSVKLLMEVCQDIPEETSGTLKRAIKLQQLAIDEIRTLSKKLSAPSLGNLKLSDSVKELINSCSIGSKLLIDYTFNGGEDFSVDQYIHLAVYRILQEHLTNVIKHSAATEVSVFLTIRDNTVEVKVLDNGIGFDTKAKASGIGVQNMKARAESTGGNFDLYSAPGEGTTLSVIVPML